MIPELNDALRMAEGIDWKQFEEMGFSLPDEGKRKEAAAKRAALAGAAARIAQSDDGRAIFKMLADVTLFRPVFETQFGVDPMQAYARGCFREGQNAVIGALFKLAVEGGALPGFDEPPAKPRKARPKKDPAK